MILRFLQNGFVSFAVDGDIHQVGHGGEDNVLKVADIGAEMHLLTGSIDHTWHPAFRPQGSSVCFPYVRSWRTAQLYCFHLVCFYFIFWQLNRPSGLLTCYFYTTGL